MRPPYRDQMIVTQDPHLRTRFVVDYQFTEQFMAGADEVDEPFNYRGMARAYDPKDADAWFHPYAKRKLSRDTQFRPVRAWLAKANAEVVYQVVPGGVAKDRDGDPMVICATHRFAMVFLDPAKAALFKLWVSGFNSEEAERVFGQ